MLSKNWSLTLKKQMNKLDVYLRNGLHKTPGRYPSQSVIGIIYYSLVVSL